VRLKKPPTSVAEPGSPDDEHDKAAVNRGEAFRILREDFPEFFKRDWNCTLLNNMQYAVFSYQAFVNGACFEDRLSRADCWLREL
jgi:hypothetical protein